MNIALVLLKYNMTALAMKGDRDSWIEAPMNGHISKPIDIRDLPKTIERVIPPPDNPGSQYR